jgi:tRNA-Thr(GGU) m(6)t(6)A37 methyltransferase TsaA
LATTVSAFGDIRPGEVTVELAPAQDAALRFIGRVVTPWTDRADCPRRGDMVEGPLCRLEIDPVWRPALRGVERLERLQILYWMHHARRDLAVQAPRGGAGPVGTFALRSPMRPNPIASSVVRLVAVEDGALVVRGLDCLSGTPLLDVKPDRCAHD